MPSRTDLRQAMWSVYNHASFRSGLKESILPERFRPIPLLQALDFLIEPSDAHDWSRRQRALRKLVAARLIDRSRLEVFVGVEEAQMLWDREVRLASLVGVNLAELASLPPEDALVLLDQLLSTSSTAQPCVFKDASCVACYDGGTLKTKVTAR